MSKTVGVVSTPHEDLYSPKGKGGRAKIGPKTDRREIHLDELIEEYGIDARSTRPVQIPGTKPTTRVFEVEKAGLKDELLNTYILDTPEGRDIACHQHIVGKELKSFCYGCAEEASKAILHLSSVRDADPDSVVHLHVLRAGPGYSLHESLPAVGGVRPRQVHVRPEYVIPSYRDHSNEMRELRVAYRDFKELPRGRELIVVKPDTEATGRTAGIAIEETSVACEEVGSRISELILYGFIAKEALERVKKVAKDLGIDRVIALALEDVPVLASNGYDMIAYGIDEGLWREKGEIRKLGSVVDRSTLLELVREYVPGLDQPGDFSERQDLLFDGKGWVRGDVEGHLRKTMDVIGSIQGIPGALEPWQDEIAETELKSIYRKLVEIRSRSGAR